MSIHKNTVKRRTVHTIHSYYQTHILALVAAYITHMLEQLQPTDYNSLLIQTYFRVSTC